MLVNEENRIVQEDDYYPFGLAHSSWQRASAQPNKYLCNGKEMQGDLSIDWYDYGARMYMPEIGRWGVVDPLSEQYLGFSPYAFTANNPINFIDPNGKEIINKDAERLRKAIEEYIKASKKFYSKGYGDRKLKKKDFDSKAERKEYKALKRELNSAKSEFNDALDAFVNTANYIEDFNKIDPENFEKLNNATYKDKNSQTHKLDIYVSSGSVLNKGKTEWSYSPDHGQLYFIVDNNIYRDAVQIILNLGTNTRELLAHEFGHVLGILSDPKGYSDIAPNNKNKKLIDCQDVNNRDHPFVKPAVDNQERFLKLINRTNTNK